MRIQTNHVATGQLGRREGRASQSGLTLIEVMFATLIFVMIALMFAAVLPVVTRNTQMSSRYQQAISVAQHKLDQVKEGGTGKLNGAYLLSQKFIDSNPAQVGPTFTYSFVNTDNITSYFPAGATATITVAPYLPSFVASSNIYTVYVLSVTVSWQDGSYAPSSYTAYTMVGQG